MAARRYVHRHLDSVALMKTLGATRGFTLASASRSCSSWHLLAAIARLRPRLRRAGVAGAHAPKGCSKRDLPPAGAGASGVGFLTAIAVLAGFALPPLLQLSRMPALRVLRRDVGPPAPLVILAFGPAVAVVFLLIYGWCASRALPGVRPGLAAFVVVVALPAAAGVPGESSARRRGSVLALWPRQPRAAAHRERGAAHGFRTAS